MSCGRLWRLPDVWRTRFDAAHREIYAIFVQPLSMGGGISTSNCALRIDWSLSRKVATILACESSAGRLSQAAYITYLVTTLERFAASGSENPPLVTHPLMPGTFLSTASTSADTYRRRNCEAPAGS